MTQKNSRVISFNTGSRHLVRLLLHSAGSLFCFQLGIKVEGGKHKNIKGKMGIFSRYNRFLAKQYMVAGKVWKESCNYEEGV
jgi:hypothetical protein